METKANSSTTVIPSPLEGLNSLIGGWKPGEFIVIGGRPSTGKTSLAIQSAITARMHGENVQYYSIEMGIDEFNIRSSFCENALRAKGCNTGTGDGPVNHNPALFITDNPGISTAEIAEDVSRMVREKGVGLAVVDYLQLVQGPSGLARKGMRTEEVDAIAKALKRCAAENGIPVIALSQMSWSSGSPSLGDLRESASIGELADLVILIDEGRLIVAKNVHGETGEVTVGYDDKGLIFQDM